MQTYELLVVNRSVLGNSEDMSVVRHSIGIDKIHVMFDNAEWLDFGIEAVFGYGDDLIVVPLEVTPIADSEDWVAEAECVIPWEAIASEQSSIRVTFRGINAETGDYIITEAASPISIDQSGDTGPGEEPGDEPTVDQFTAAYSLALTGANAAATAAAAAGSAADDAANAAADTNVATEAALEAIEAMGDISELAVPLMSSSTRGGAKLGDGLSIDENGALNVTSVAQSDWEQDDSTQADYIKNKPFGETTRAATLYEGTGLTLNTTQYLYPDNVKWGKVDGFALSEYLVVGQTYTVTVDGVETECVAAIGSEDMIDEAYPRGDTVYVHGAVLEGTNFKILGATETVGTQTPKAFIAGVTTTHSLKVETIDTSVAKLPAQFIPIDNDTIKIDANGRLYIDVSAIS